MVRGFSSSNLTDPMLKQTISGALRKAADEYPDSMVDEQVRDVPRIAFNIGLVLESAKPKLPSTLELCDIGGGIGLFSVGCAAVGLKRTVLIDDFNDSVNHIAGASILELHLKHGVEVISRDVIEKGVRDLKGDFDIITSFDSMEHWHHSPKNLFQQVMEKLKPAGIFVLGVPNCVNMRKRVTVPLGIGKWSNMEEWFEADVFRGHVREPDVRDLKYIANDMGLIDVKIYGRNWLGHYSANPAIRLATKIMDYPLRIKPSFCSDIYMVGRKV